MPLFRLPAKSDQRMKLEVRLAQWLLAAVFLVAGGFRLWQALRGVPIGNDTLLLSTAEMLLGVLLAAGWQLRAVALLAAALLLADAALSHPFWRLAGGAQMAQLLQFMKNMGLVGGLVLLSGAGGAKRR
jgi:putative oxidoreductase